jgi:cell division protein FtsN
VYRVRVGPFEKQEEGERAKDKLGKAGIESVLVRVQN